MGTLRDGTCISDVRGVESDPCFTPYTNYLSVKKVEKRCYKEIQEGMAISWVFLSKQNPEAVKKGFIDFTSSLELHKTNDIISKVNRKETAWKKHLYMSQGS